MGRGGLFKDFRAFIYNNVYALRPLTSLSSGSLPSSEIETDAARVVNDGAAEKTFFFIEHGALSRSDCTDGSFRANEPTTVRKRFHAAGNGFAVVADANREVGGGENE